MANKRDLKKRIKLICGELASDTLLASTFFCDKVDTNKLNLLINEIAALQEDTLAFATFSFDRTPRDFDSLADYHKERRKYFAVAYKKLDKDFIDRAVEIVNQLNEAIPNDVRKEVSSM